ncbi:MAG: hypothetical protein ABFR90_06880 [Planctomycetota bacterium]
MRRNWILFLCLFCILCGSLFAAAGDEHAFELKWQAEGFHEQQGVDLERTESFAVEPDFGDREVLRGQLSVGPSGNKEQVGFAWDISENKLYVDLNRDGDLTNDPNGVIGVKDASDRRNHNYYFETFPLSISTKEGVHRYQISVLGQNYPWHQMVTFTVRSGYSGAVELYGQMWGFEIGDRFKTQVGVGDTLSVRPKEQVKEGALKNHISSLPAPKSLFMDGHCYDLAFEFRKSDNDSLTLWCTLTEKDAPLAKLRIEGEGISQLVFGDGSRLNSEHGMLMGPSDVLILPRLSESEMTVPVGNFWCRSLSLKGNEDRSVTPQGIDGIGVSVVAETDNVLKAGAPLNHQVKIQRSGKVLKFDYELVGIGGEKYDMRQISGYDNNNKPSVAIYKVGMQLAAGEFEYG